MTKWDSPALIGLAWFPDRAAKVPHLFVRVSEPGEEEGAREGESIVPGAAVQ